MLRKSIKLALEKHGSQVYGVNPYIYHLIKVYLEVYKYEKNEEILSLAFLHDTLEDTEISIKELSEISESMAEYVDLLTKMPFINYYQRCSKYYATSIVKMADRIVNVRECLENKNYNQFIKYYNERKKFRVIYPKLSLKMILSLESLYFKGKINSFRILLY